MWPRKSHWKSAQKIISNQTFCASQEVGGTWIGEEGLVIMAGEEKVEWYQIHQTHGLLLFDVIPIAPFWLLWASSAASCDGSHYHLLWCCYRCVFFTVSVLNTNITHRILQKQVCYKNTIIQDDRHTQCMHMDANSHIYTPTPTCHRWRISNCCTCIKRPYRQYPPDRQPHEHIMILPTGSNTLHQVCLSQIITFMSQFIPISIYS